VICVFANNLPFTENVQLEKNPGVIAKQAHHEKESILHTGF
jgi:hypothetical protein